MPEEGSHSVVNNNVICDQCRMEVDEANEENMQCDKCKKIVQCLYTKLDKRQFQHLPKHKYEDLCNDEDLCNMLENELKKIKTKLNKLDQLNEVTKAIDFISQLYDALLKKIVENNKKLEIVQKENSFFKNE